MRDKAMCDEIRENLSWSQMAQSDGQQNAGAHHLSLDTHY
jgi:hypothetical protein